MGKLASKEAGGEEDAALTSIANKMMERAGLDEMGRPRFRCHAGEQEPEVTGNKSGAIVNVSITGQIGSLNVTRRGRGRRKVHPDDDGGDGLDDDDPQPLAGPGQAGFMAHLPTRNIVMAHISQSPAGTRAWQTMLRNPSSQGRIVMCARTA